MEPGFVEQQEMYAFVIGQLHPNQTELIGQLANTFKKSNVSHFISNDIMTKKWEKLLWNVTFNPLSATANSTVGEILESAHLNSIAEDVLDEALMIAKASGIEVKENIKQEIFRDASSVKSHKTSMLQDKLKNKPMEIESLCGFLVNKAASLKVDAPVTKTLYRLLSFMDIRE